MPQETELQIDDGTYSTAFQIRCAACEGQAYLERASKEMVMTDQVEVAEYTYTCPTPGCTTSVVVRVPHAVTA